MKTKIEKQNEICTLITNDIEYIRTAAYEYIVTEKLDIKRIDKICQLFIDGKISTSRDIFDNVSKFCSRVTSDHSLNHWTYIAEFFEGLIEEDAEVNSLAPRLINDLRERQAKKNAPTKSENVPKKDKVIYPITVAEAVRVDDDYVKVVFNKEYINSHANDKTMLELMDEIMEIMNTPSDIKGHMILPEYTAIDKFKSGYARRTMYPAVKGEL